LPLARAIAAPSVSPAAANGPASAPTRPFALQSSAFADGARLPTDFTCDGAGQSPPLSWADPPPGTAAYALVVQDVDARAGGAGQPLTHWLLYNMPASVTQLPAGVPTRPLLTNGSQQGLNSQQTIGYASPCPNRGDPAHHYTFQLLAQDGYVTLETGAGPQDVQAALSGHTVGQVQLSATFQR
jgi:Raf kinase inhibitor-like YbhB/YbcL family protein